MFVGTLSGLSNAWVWATTSLLVKAPAVRAVHVLSFNTFRVLAASLFFLALLPFFGGWEAFLQFSTTSYLTLALSSIVGIAVGDTLYFWSVAQIGVSRALPISGIHPIFTWVLAVLVVREPITPRAVVGTVLVLLSLYLLAPASEETGTTTSPPTWRGVFAAIAACVLWATSTILLKIGLQDGANAVAVNAYRLPLSALALLMMLQLKLGRLAREGFNRRNVPALTAISLYSTGLGTLLWVLTVEYLGAGRATLINTIAPLIGVPLSKLFLREHVTGRILIGALLSMIGVVTIVWEA